MKKLITITLLLLVVIACKKEKSPLSKIQKTVEKVKKAKQNMNSVNTIAKGFQGMQQNIEKLKKLTPINKETIKTWMPEKVLDMKRTKYEIGKQMGFAMVSNVNLDYKTADKSKGVSLKIIDGAGNGATQVSMTALSMQADVESESETGYKKTKTFDNQKILVEYSNPKYANRSLFKYTIDDRIYVEARGWGLKPNELWSYLKQLEIEKLIKS